MIEPTGTASLLGDELMLAERIHPEEEEGSVASYHDRDPIRRMMVFSGRSNPDLAHAIGQHLGLTLGEVELKTFPNGELYVRFCESIRGADVFLVQSCANPVNRNLMELLLMVNAAKLASAKRITAVMPWYPYSRADKKSAPREPISARLVADILQAAGVDRVLTMDLHAGQVQGFFNVPVDHMTALPMFAQYFRDQGLPQDRLVVVSPDAGRVKLAKKFAEMLGGDLAFINKERPGHGESRVMTLIGDVKGKVAIISDDLIDSAGTLCNAAQAVADAGAERVLACATHGVFSPPAFEKMDASVLERVVVCDTIPVDPLTRPAKVEVLSVAGILAQTIDNVFRDDSVSAIFKGENQLF
jgi:ribose-phosphate pyrophosphokinase